MSINRPDFDNLAEKDLIELIDVLVPKGLHLDYKRDLYTKSDEQKKEFLKDISGFANAMGGHLIIGIDEKQGLPTATPGLNGDCDQVMQWLEQVASTGIEPRIQGLRLKAIALSTGKFCIVIRVPRSWRPPHQVTLNRRFWIRNSTFTIEASMDQLRTLFAFGGDISARAREFCESRLKLPYIGTDLPPGCRGRLFLHVIPLSALVSSATVDIASVQPATNGAFFAPLRGGYSPQFNLDGFISQGEGGIYTQLFRTGIIEAVEAGIVAPQLSGSCPYIAATVVEHTLVKSLPRYVAGLRDLDISPPLIVIVSLQNVKGAYYAVGQSGYSSLSKPPIDVDNVRLPEGLIPAFGVDSDYDQALKPAFDALWNAAGRPKAGNFSPESTWTAPKGKRQ